MRAFIIRPFGTKKGIDFDRVEKELIAPALDHVHAEGRTTGEILKAGNIRIDMFQQLLVADLVVTDTSINNANAFYELGIRHALRDKRTLLIRAKTRSPRAAAAKNKSERKKSPEKDEVPFDLRTDRYLEYDPKKPGDSLEKLIGALAQTFASEEQDSPVFISLPGLEVQDRSRFLPVPLDFTDEVRSAEASQNGAKLTLLGLEAVGFPWESEGLRRVGRSLFALKAYGGAKVSWESVRNLEEFDIEANTMLGNIYQRLDDITSSNLALERVIKKATRPKDLAEAHGQLGRNKKQIWRNSWSSAASPNRSEEALKSPLLEEAYEQYLQAYNLDLNSYYPGLNALGLAAIITELVSRAPAAWSGRFAKPKDADQKLTVIEEKRKQLASTLEMSLAAAEARLKLTDPPDPWLRVSIADLKLLTLPQPEPAIFDYKKALQSGNSFVRDAAYSQLKMFSDLDFCKANVDKALEIVQPSQQSGSQRPHRIVLFTGHRIDDAGRKKPRFPAKAEAKARQAIRDCIEQQRRISTDAIVGVAGGANGGDILFHEVCEELGIATELLLALPIDQFVQESVDSQDKGWIDRFYNILKKQQPTPVLAQSKVLPKWLQTKRGYDIWQRNNLWLLGHALCRAAEHLTVVALWDGQTGDGPGGTENMVSIAKSRGARVIVLDTRKLFNLP